MPALIDITHDSDTCDFCTHGRGPLIEVTDDRSGCTWMICRGCARNEALDGKPLWSVCQGCDTKVPATWMSPVGDALAMDTDLLCGGCLEVEERLREREDGEPCDRCGWGGCSLCLGGQS